MEQVAAKHIPLSSKPSFLRIGGTEVRLRYDGVDPGELVLWLASGRTKGKKVPLQDITCPGRGI